MLICLSKQSMVAGRPGRRMDHAQSVVEKGKTSDIDIVPTLRPHTAEEPVWEQVVN